MATRSVKVSMERRRVSGDMNDNNPSVLLGHELTGLEGVPRPPAGEAVSHYSRFTQIDSFPEHPSEPAQVEAAEQLPMDAMPERAGKTITARGTSLIFSGMGSCLFHAIVVAVLLITFVATPEEAQEEAGDTVSVIMIGNSDSDQMAAGDEQKQPEQITSEEVQPQTVQPTEVTQEEIQAPQPDVVQPQTTETQPVQTAEAVQPVEQTPPETVASEQPQILATQVPAETTVVQPVDPVQPVENEVVEAQPVEPAPEVVTPVEKPKPVDKPKEIKKPVAKIVKAKSGSKGDSQQDSKRGSADGTETAQSDTNSQLNARRASDGSAARSNYVGKIQSCIRRAIKGISAKGDNATVVVGFKVDASGRISSSRILSGSGNSEVDQDMLAAVRGVGSCDPIPSELGLSSMPFNIPFLIKAGRF